MTKGASPSLTNRLLIKALFSLFSCVLLVHWSVQVNKDGGVKASVELLPKVPHSALQLFQSSPVAGAAEAFHSLQRILGVEGALEAAITAITEAHDQ
uniref:Uncharacterized protein n=1 Tax=Neogobius melanostomus TaxID=47308 RepID=A0A8C6WRI2_9GOBI